ncbi:MAG: hypothetical protein AB1426_09890 [Bacillota bacterium]
MLKSRNLFRRAFCLFVLSLMLLVTTNGAFAQNATATDGATVNAYKEFLKHKRIAEDQYRKAIEEGNKAVEESESFILTVPKDGDISALWHNYWYTPQYDYESNGGSGVGVSYANAYAPYGTMDLMARAEGYGSFWAHTRLWVRFTLDGPTDTYRIDCEHLVRGVLTV